MSDKLMSQKVTKVGLVFATLGVVGGAVFAGFLLSQGSSNSTTVAQPIQSIEINSEKLKSPSNIEANKVAEEAAPEDQVLGSDSDAIEWVDGMTWHDLLTEEELKVVLGEIPSPYTQNVDNQSSQVSVKPAPTKNNKSEPGKQTQPGSNPEQQPTYNEPSLDCYGQYADACKVGFVEPSIEYAGYLSCSKLSDGTVEIKGLTRLVGGSYKDFRWDTATHNGMGIISSRVSDSTYMLSWYVTATFYSMDSRYSGVIGEASGNGLEFIDESQLDSSCRF